MDRSPPGSPQPVRLSDSYVNALMEPIVDSGQQRKKPSASQIPDRAQRLRMMANNRRSTMSAILSRGESSKEDSQNGQSEATEDDNSNVGFSRRRQRSVVLDAIMLKNLKKRPILPSVDEGRPAPQMLSRQFESYCC